MNVTPFEAEIPQEKLILSRTDLKGKITYANETFAHICGYKVEELIGKPHNIVRHPDMPQSIFKRMWETILDGKEWNGIVKNLRKDGGYYWVNAQVVPLWEDGKKVGYKSSRSYISPFLRQKMGREYAIIKNAEEGQIAFTINLTSLQWNKLKNEAEKKGVTYQALTEELVDEI